MALGAAVGVGLDIGDGLLIEVAVLGPQVGLEGGQLIGGQPISDDEQVADRHLQHPGDRLERVRLRAEVRASFKQTDSRDVGVDFAGQLPHRQAALLTARADE